MIDWNRISTLRDEVGAEDFDEVVELFLDEVEEVILPVVASPLTTRRPRWLQKKIGAKKNRHTTCRKQQSY